MLGEKELNQCEICEGTGIFQGEDCEFCDRGWIEDQSEPDPDRFRDQRQDR